MTEAEYGWASDAVANTLLNGVSPAEVVDALYSRRQLVNDIGDLRYVCAPALSGRLLVVKLRRIYPEVQVFVILVAREASDAETGQWRDR